MATSGNALFDRRARLTIAVPVDTPGDFTHTTTDVIEINAGKTDNGSPGLRVKFTVKKTLKKTPNTSEIIVTNLSPSRRASLQRKGVKVLLEGGYKQSGVFRIFSGDVRTIDHVRNGADWDTTLKLGDGERAWRFARVAESFEVGTRFAEALKKVGRATGLELGNLDQVAGTINVVFDQGFTAFGSAVQVLARMSESIGKELSVQDGALQILDPYGALDLPIPEISPTSGLIGSPEMGTPPSKGKPALLKFKSLLIATKPGGKVKLVSDRYNGYVRIHEVTFTGDTHSGDWFSEMSGTIAK